MSLAKLRSVALLVALHAGFFGSIANASSSAITWFSSTAGQHWQAMPAPTRGPLDYGIPPQVRVTRQKTYQTIDGFGGCFNEVSWVALSKASATDRQQALSSLFGDDGCAFALGRLPIGASDFAIDAYSLDDTPDDFDLKAFSIARDEKQLIPFAKAALAVRPSLRCWGSPWSPPAWMKTSGSYSKGSLRWEPRILRSYATYLARWVEAYRAAGIPVYAITPQNEPNILSDYPSCLWTAVQLREFIADYLGPTLRERRTNVELWLGLNGDPFNHGENINDRLFSVLEDPKARGFLTGVAFQYDSRNQISTASQLYPGMKFMQSETECLRGDNSWADAQHLFQLIKRYLDGGAGAYFAWNLVLDETGKSTWGWRQNALITVNAATGRLTYNGEYYVMRHFSQFVKPGARRVLSTGPWIDVIAFVNPDGAAIVVVGNSDKREREFTLSFAEQPDMAIKVSLSAESINTFVVER